MDDKIIPIPTFAINLKKRVDRKAHIINQFKGRNEFDLKIVEAIEDKIPTLGIWKSILHIIKNLTNEEDEYIIVCEDDHEFTKDYTAEGLRESIKKAKSLDADILYGGLISHVCAIPVSDNLFWVQFAFGNQFMLIFKKFFPVLISNEHPKIIYLADYKISTLSDRKLVIHPFISVQKEFGYSDVSPENEKEGHISTQFQDGNKRLYLLTKLWNRFQSIKAETKKESNEIDVSSLIISTFIISSPKKKKNLKHIQTQFDNKPEFDITIVESCKHKNEAVGFWQTIRKIIQTAIENDEEVIIICRDDHEFTKNYSKEYLFGNIIKACRTGVGCLMGECSAIQHAIPFTENLYWTNACSGKQFIVIYKQLFRKIMDEPVDEKILTDDPLSGIVASKMVLYPAISVSKNITHSAIAPLQNENFRMSQNFFYDVTERLEKIREAYLMFNK
ncbi:MAG: glycosyltransferase family 25 protein [Chitinophagaceae bacterium]|jgi:GR25 family glycosyltransferase involved in LPS biosynthesis|nr:glycosyltransferase family 25 protein [Chitinophagaceae bacterium]